MKCVSRASWTNWRRACRTAVATCAPSSQERLQRRQDGAVPLAGAERLVHDLLIGDDEPQRHACVAADAVAIGSQVVRPMLVAKDIEQAWRVHLPGFGATKVR